MLPDPYFDQFQTPKYRAQNPVQRWLIRRFADRVLELVDSTMPIGSILEVGSGEGFLTGAISQAHPEVSYTAVDLSESDLDRLSTLFPRVECVVANAQDLSELEGRQFDLVLCAEVLEHLDSPAQALEQMLQFSPKHLVLTVPHEPWFMLANLARLKNVTRLGNDIEHVNHWSKRGFRGFVGERARVVSVDTSFPWLVAHAVPTEQP